MDLRNNKKIPAYESSINVKHLGVKQPDSVSFPVDTSSLFRIRFLNPYKNYNYYYKGQVHAHSKRSDGSLKPKNVLKYYKNRGYFFISLTDHDDELECWQIFKDPKVPNIVYAPGEEGGKGHKTHFLELNLTKCPPSGEFLLKKWNYHTVEQGGLTVAPHSLSSEHTWSQNQLFDLEWLTGLEIKNNAGYAQLWDRLLKGDRQRWGFCVDDFHSKANVNHGWIMVNSEDKNPNRFDLFANIKNGNFYSV
ncbi:MAG: hypothetical protein HC831_07010 [Chloroflexia bacterium]|nr:hypothetical protein [Chloroflexia bacterium]